MPAVCRAENGSRDTGRERHGGQVDDVVAKLLFRSTSLSVASPVIDGITDTEAAEMYPLPPRVKCVHCGNSFDPKHYGQETCPRCIGRGHYDGASQFCRLCGEKSK